MGNTESNVTSGVKKQAGGALQEVYKLVDLKGGGLLVELMKRATQTKQYAELDHAIKTKVEPYLYNKGEGRKIPISQIVLLRNKERSKSRLLPPLRGFDDPEEYDIDKHAHLTADLEDLKDPTKYRDVCWDVNKRGAVGETALHLCLLHATALHADLAKRLLRFYPKLINDVYMNDEYYGENVLHIAIVNEDPAMVKFLLDSNVDFHERCYGAFMSPEDQKGSRGDSLDHEWVDCNPLTNYDGYVYWGEYPLSFAACLGQEECYRLILARGANPNNQDSNGNTVLHMLVVYQKVETFDMAYEAGADINIKNSLNLTPLTLAAKLAKTEIFFHILNIQREIYWQIGSITCAAYPLALIDTIDIKTGNICKDSALNLVVFGERDEHLDLMEGMLVDLLHAKWNTFVKARFYRQFIMFFFYFLFSLFCFTLRPGPPPITPKAPAPTPLAAPNFTDYDYPSSGVLDATLFDSGPTATTNWTALAENRTSFVNKSSSADYDGFRSFGNFSRGLWGGMANIDYQECRLLDLSKWQAKVRVVCEIAMEIGAILYIIAALREARFLGRRMFLENLMTAPSRVLFLGSCILMMIMPWVRSLCLTQDEDIMAVVIMVTTAPYFLFFCRGFKTVGPFVVMIYRMLKGDLIRFVSIYLVFVMGFSQAYYIIFLSYEMQSANPLPNPIESIMAMFLMSLTSFGDYYPQFEKTTHETGSKFMFVLFMAIVAILLVNMLIAMMGNTYQKIAETKNEWQRQWARIVLVVERGVPPAERLKSLMDYSQPMADGRRALVLRLNQSEDDKEEMKEILEMKRIHDRMVKRRLLREQMRKDEAAGIVGVKKPDPYSTTKKKKPPPKRY
ncbi:transient receptor potential cation channel subfamily V member 5 [Cloeon dipterum]|uniref:transient receptor potential cation channel subfamily V member 5 n=1 Tax=Cloeon dipterum TaxID=197152 RepID=UPI0032204A8F